MSIVPVEMLEEAARRFALLSDPTRLRIVSTLQRLGPTTVGALAEASGTTMTNVSQHLARLAAGGIVGRRREGRSVIYWISDPVIEDLCRLVCASLRDRARMSS